MSIEINFSALPNEHSALEQAMGLFESESPKYIAQILDGVALDDLESVRTGASMLMSSSEAVGAQTLSGRCRDIENAARLGDLDQCSELSTDLMTDFDESVVAIQLFMQRAA